MYARKGPEPGVHRGMKLRISGPSMLRTVGLNLPHEGSNTWTSEQRQCVAGKEQRQQGATAGSEESSVRLVRG